MPRPAKLLVETLQEEREIAAGIMDFVERESARGHSFMRGRDNVKRLDGLALLWGVGRITASQRTAGRRYGSEYSAFFDRSRYMSTLAYQTRENDLDLVDRALGAGLVLRHTRDEALGGQRAMVALCDLVCGRGQRCPPWADDELSEALDRLIAYYAGEPCEEDFENHLPALLTLRDEGARVLSIWRGWKDVHSLAAIKPVLSKAQGGSCPGCGSRFRRDGTLDHVFPRSRGGADAPGNLILLCEPCNKSKASLDPHHTLLAALDAVNDALGWACPDMALVAFDDDFRRRALLKTLKRLKAYERGEVAPTPARARPRPKVAEPVANDADWSDLLPTKPSRDDRAMEGTWLREQGVMRRNRGNRKMGVNNGR